MENNKIKHTGIDIVFSDLIGKMRRLTVNEHNIEEIERFGVGIDGSSIAGFGHKEKSDLVVIPDPEDIIVKGRKIQFGDVKSCNGMDFPFDSRTVLKRTKKFLQDNNIGDGIFFLPEIEFYIMDYAEIDISDTEKHINFVSREKFTKESYYHSSGEKDPYYYLRDLVVKELRNSGIDFKYHHHEVGSFGQAEIELKFMEDVVAGDVIFITKELIKEIARENELTVTFMPKIFTNHPGSGMHCHQFISKDGKNLFYDSSKNSGLSDMGRWYIGGLLLHSRAVSAITNPSVNSFRRLCGKYETPDMADYSIGKRASTIRIPAYTVNKETIRIEYRIPDATANIYLALAAQAMAGIDGILNRIDPDEVMAKQIKLPSSLSEALSALEEDHSFLTRNNVFYPELINRWIALKKEEIKKVSDDISFAEYKLYFSI